MTWSDILSEMNDVVRDVFGEIAAYTSQDGLTTAELVDLVIERLGDDGRAMCDIDTSDVATPGIGDLIAIGSDAWRIFDRMALGSGYWPCELRQASEWAQCTLHTYNRTSNGWNSTASATIWMHISMSSNVEDLGEQVGETEISSYQIVAPYNAAIENKSRIKWGSKYLYPDSVVPDDTKALRMMITAMENES